MILQYFKKKENTEKKIAQKYYVNILNKVQHLIKENSFFIEKNYNTSFEMTSLFVIILIKKNISEKNNKYKLINDYIISTFIDDLDESLRRLGIGDMSIGKYVKSYVKKFYFRIKNFPQYDDLQNTKIIEDYLKIIKIVKHDQYSSASNIIVEEIKNITK